MSRKKTTEEIYEEIYAVHGDRVIPLSPYINALTPMRFKCGICGYEWSTKPNNVKNGNGCKLCGFKSISSKKKNTREKAEKSLAKTHGDRILLIGEYKSQSEPTEFKCTVCGHIWVSTLKNVKSIESCPNCAKEIRASKRRLPLSIVDSRVKKSSNGTIVRIGEYTTCVEPVEFFCRVCGHKWCTTPQIIFDGSGCPVCNINSMKNSVDDIINSVYTVHRNRVKLIGEYINRNTKVWWECTVCGKRWEATPSNIIGGKGCPKCRLSKGETQIDDWLEDNIGASYYVSQKTFEDLLGVGGRKLSYDFYIPDKNACIEYQGLQHFRPSTFGSKTTDPSKRLSTQREHDRRKKEYCVSNGIKLIEITDKDKKNITSILSKELLE